MEIHIIIHITRGFKINQVITQAKSQNKLRLSESKNSWKMTSQQMGIDNMNIYIIHLDIHFLVANIHIWSIFKLSGIPPIFNESD